MERDNRTGENLLAGDRSSVLPADSSEKPSFAGPADRESFRRAQARNRRHARLLSILCLLTALVMGIPLAALISPLLCAAIVLGADLVNLIHRTPDIGGIVVARLSLAIKGPPSPAGVASLIALGLIPGALFMLMTWVGVRALFLRCGVGGVLLSLNARPPRAEELEEQTLADVVTEMAVAAGVKPPRLTLIDLEAANAAAVGSSLNDSALVVTRGLLSYLNREEMQGVIAHLLGSVGNGDLRAAMEMLSLFQTLAMVEVLMETPFGPQSRSLLRRLLRYAFSGRGRKQDSEAGMLSEMLALHKPDRNGDIDQFEKTHGNRMGIARFLLAPLMITALAFSFTSTVFNAWLLGPLLAMTWRSRRYLADATAVQLTRNPQGLAQALTRLSQPFTPTVVAAGIPTQHLFIAWPHNAQKGALDTETLMSFQPPIEKRLQRLSVMGANIGIRSEKASKSGCLIALWMLLGPLMFVAFCASFAGAAMTVFIGLLVDMLYLMIPVVLPLHHLLRHILTG